MAGRGLWYPRSQNRALGHPSLMGRLASQHPGRPPAHSGYIGTCKVAHLEENIAAAGLEPSAEDWAELESAASG